jgi:hypothetical protein
MKYLLVIYGNQEKWASIPAEEWPEAIAKQDAFNRKYQATGELIGAYGPRRPPGRIDETGQGSDGSLGRRSSRILSPMLIVPPDRMSARRPPRWMRSLMMPGRVSFCR